jgi:hypothetical protein
VQEVFAVFHARRRHDSKTRAALVVDLRAAAVYPPAPLL